MEKFNISVSRGEEVFQFEVLSLEKDSCEFEVYRDGVLVASFEPNEDEYIRICRNQGGLDEDIVYLIADKIEAYNL